MQRFPTEACQLPKIKTMKNIIACLLTSMAVISLAIGCSKSQEKSSMQENLAGTWQWIRTDGGIAAHIHNTPANTGKNVELKITADGKYAIYTNDILTAEGTYTLETKRCIHDHTDKTFINFSSDQDLMVEKLTNDQLDVSDDAYDGFASVYKRKTVNVK
jgi:hypothetical protein